MRSPRRVEEYYIKLQLIADWLALSRHDQDRTRLPAQGQPRRRVMNKKASLAEIFITFLSIGAIELRRRRRSVSPRLRSSVKRSGSTTSSFWRSPRSATPCRASTRPTSRSSRATVSPASCRREPRALKGCAFRRFVFMTAAGLVYAEHHVRPLANAALARRRRRGGGTACLDVVSNRQEIAAAASTMPSLVVAAILGITYFKVGVPLTLLVVGAAAIIAHRLHARGREKPAEETDEWIKIPALIPRLRVPFVSHDRRRHGGLSPR